MRKENHKRRPMPPLFQLHDTRSLQPPSPTSEKFCPLASHPLSPQSECLRKPSMLNRRSTLPALLDVNSESLMLSRQLHLDFHEVKCVVQELRRDGNRKSNGGMDLAAFRHVMLRVFGIDDINDFVLQDAYDQCNVAAGPIDTRKFMTWYRDHLFNLQASKSQAEQGDDLTLELAKKHHCSCIDLDRVKLKFDHFDVDKSGVIDFQEFEAMMHELLNCHSKSDLPQNRLNRFWHEADIDGNGVIDFQEFTEWYLKYFADASNNGPVEAFYASFMPDVQRAHKLENLIQTTELVRERKWDAEVMKSYLKAPYSSSELA
eukprot:symbB.v1.2.010710.t1/scaffold676.1/size173388/17